jgi:anti-sigma B factor antagonist
MSHGIRHHLQVESIDGVGVVRFVDTGIVFNEVIQEVGDQLYDLVENKGYTRLLLNFGNVGIISTSLLGKLNGLNKRIAKAKGRLRLCCLHPDLREVFRITNLESTFAIDDDERTSLEQFGRAGGDAS